MIMRITLLLCNYENYNYEMDYYVIMRINSSKDHLGWDSFKDEFCSIEEHHDFFWWFK